MPDGDEAQIFRAHQEEQCGVPKCVDIGWEAQTRRHGHQRRDQTPLPTADIASVIIEPDGDSTRCIFQRSTDWTYRPICLTRKECRTMQEKIGDPRANASLELTLE